MRLHVCGACAYWPVPVCIFLVQACAYSQLFGDHRAFDALKIRMYRLDASLCAGSQKRFHLRIRRGRRNYSADQSAEERNVQRLCTGLRACFQRGSLLGKWIRKELKRTVCSDCVLGCVHARKDDFVGQRKPPSRMRMWLTVVDTC